jgi:hypothetical protein
MFKEMFTESKSRAIWKQQDGSYIIEVGHGITSIIARVDKNGKILRAALSTGFGEPFGKESGDKRIPFSKANSKIKDAISKLNSMYELGTLEKVNEDFSDKELFEAKDQFSGWEIEVESYYGYEAIRYGTGYSSISLFIDDGEYCSASTNKHGDAGAKGGEWGKKLSNVGYQVKREHKLSRLSNPEIEFMYSQIEKSNRTKKVQPLTDAAYREWQEKGRK